MSAAADLRAGMSQADVARKHGVTKGTVSKWAKALQDGQGALARKRPPPQSPFTEQEWHLLKKILGRPATTYGYEVEGWTAQRVAEVAQNEFGHCPSVSRLYVVVPGRIPVRWSRQSYRGLYGATTKLPEAIRLAYLEDDEQTLQSWTQYKRESRNALRRGILANPYTPPRRGR